MGHYTTDGAYHDDCLPKVAHGEPHFVLRAQDRSAPTVVRIWCQLALLHGVPAEKVAVALKDAEAMEAWQQGPGRDRVKWPD